MFKTFIPIPNNSSQKEQHGILDKPDFYRKTVP